MGWSPWQPGFDVTQFATSLQLDWLNHNGQARAAGDEFVTIFNYLDGDYGSLVRGRQFKRAATWETYRTFPYPMFDLTEGVDYIEVPGHPGMYYEYQSGPNVFQNWIVPNLVLSSVNDGLGTRTFRMLMVLETNYVAGPLPDFDPDEGVPFGVAWNGSTPNGTVIGAPDPGLATSFSIWPSEPPYDFSVENGYQMYLPVISARYVFRLPQWRYWMPGDEEPVVIPPMRQRQRGDGATTGIASQKGTADTAQAGLRSSANTPY